MPFFKQLEEGSKSELFPPKGPRYDFQSESSKHSSSPKAQISLRLRLIAAVSFAAALICIISLIVMVSKLNHRTTQLEHFALEHLKKERSSLQVEHQVTVTAEENCKNDHGQINSNCQKTSSDEEQDDDGDNKKEESELESPNYETFKELHKTSDNSDEYEDYFEEW